MSAQLLRAQLRGRPRPAAGQRRARAALVELQRQGDRADPGARHADRHAVVESGAGEQGGGHRRTAAAIRSQPWQRRSDLHAGRRVELRALRALAGQHRRDGVAAAGQRPARHRRRRLPLDVSRARDRGAARAARQPRRHRAREASDRPRRPQSAEPVSVRHRHRPQRARQKPVQRTRRHALVHGVSAGHDRRLSRLAHAGGRNCRGAVRRSSADGTTIARRRLSRARQTVRPDQRSRPEALEARKPGSAAAHEAAAARRSITAWACRRWRKVWIGTR